MFAALTDGTRPRAGKTHPPISGAPKSDVLHIGTALIALNLGRDSAAHLIELLNAPLTLMHASGLQRAGPTRSKMLFRRISFAAEFLRE